VNNSEPNLLDYETPPPVRGWSLQARIDVLIAVVLVCAPIYPTHVFYFGRSDGDTYHSLAGIAGRAIEGASDIAYHRPAWFLAVYPLLFLLAAVVSRLIVRGYRPE
jgi:hypothetical protein